MGSGIAEVCARAGLDVIVREITDAAAAAGHGRITRSLDKGVKAGKLTQAERDAAFDRLTVTTDVGDLAERDLVIEAVTENPVGYVKERQQFGRRIGDFQGMQFMLADMAMKTEAARQLTYHAAALSELAMRGKPAPGLTFASSAAKCFASDTAMQVTTDAVQLLGGYGYVRDFPVERMMRDAKITQIYEGTNQIQLVVMARSLLA
jgi:alkylation response protein AidB-like acyl-CoA dehydrogenase